MIAVDRLPQRDASPCWAWRARASPRRAALAGRRRAGARLGRRSTRGARRPRARACPLADLAAGRSRRRSRRWCCRPAFRTAIPRRIRSRRAPAQAGIAIIGDIELLARSVPRRALCRHHRHQRQIDHHGAHRAISSQRPGGGSQVGGNLGVPALPLDALGPDGIYVLEMSSYQLELTTSARLRRRGAAQHHARPSRPAWRHGGLYRRQGAHLRSAGRRQCARHRHRRRDLPRHRRSACRAPAPAGGADLGRARGAGRRLRRRTAGSSTTWTARPERVLDLQRRSSACRAGTIGRTPPPPMPRRAASASTPTRRRGHCRASPASPIARS